jgi:2-hydroxychromene-2-carboxylate isomerase
MGELVRLDEHRLQRQIRKSPDAPRAKLFVDLADPFSYLAAERVERAFPTVTWRLASQGALERSELAQDPDRVAAIRAAAERRAAGLRLPLQWPDAFPAPVPAAMRAAAYAIEVGRGGPFIVAAGRLAFCGGFDLDDPEVLMEAAAAAGIALEDCLDAARDPARDAPIEAAGRHLLAIGADRVPALRIGRALVWSESRISAYLLTGAAMPATQRL